MHSHYAKEQSNVRLKVLRLLLSTIIYGNFKGVYHKTSILLFYINLVGMPPY